MKTEWKKCKLSSQISLIGGGTPKTSVPEYWNGEIPWLSVKDFNDDNRYVYKTEKYITQAGLEHSSTTLLQKDDIIISARGTVGEMAMIPFPMAFNQSCYGIRGKENNDQTFIYYLIKNSVRKLKAITHGSVFDTITRETFDNIEVTIPHLTVQKKIAGVLKSLDDKIELNRQISKNLEEQARCLFEKTFPKNKTFKMLPLSELCTAITKGTTPTTLGKAFAKSGINFIKAESILDNHSVDFDKFSFIDDETNKMLGRSIIHSGDIDFTIAGTLGRFALIDESVIPANTNQAVAIIRSDTKIISPEYLYSFFIGNWHNNYYTKRIQQAVQANLSLGTIKSLPIPILEKNEMKSYLTSLTPIFKIQSEKIKENRKLAQIRDTILPKLMSGEIKV